MTPNEKQVRLTPGCLRAIRAERKFQMRSVLKHDRQEAADPAATRPPFSPGDYLRADDDVGLRVTSVRMERLHEITDQDLVREGGMWHETASPGSTETDRHGFARWWDEVHARPESKWVENPWVWVIEFERTHVT